MAGHSSGNWGIFLAVIVSSGLIGAAYMFATNSATTKVEASTETALLQGIASQDSDQDGLPDWEEVLYGTDPHKSDTRGLGMTDGQATAKGLIVPKAVVDIPKPEPAAADTLTINGVKAPAAGSLTSLFADNFLTAYIDEKDANEGADLTPDQVVTLANKIIENLLSQLGPTPDFITAKSLRTTANSSADSLRAYAVAVEAVVNAHSPHVEKTELLYLQDATSNKDSTALAKIKLIAQAYKDVAAGIAALPVPKVLQSSMLPLINALSRVGDNAFDFARLETDPIVTMFAIKQYGTTVETLTQSYTGVATTYANEGVTFAPNDPGASFVNTMSIVRQNAASAP